jgi:hypothetical protein
MISLSKKKSKTSWRMIRDETGKSGRNSQTPTLFKNGNLIFSPIQIPNSFNDCFINVVDNLQL